MILWKRRIEVDVAGITVSEPKIALDIRRNATGTPAAGAVEMWNLAPAREALIHERGAEAVVRAGHGGEAGEVFRGDVRQVVRVRRNRARITRLRIGGRVAGARVLRGTTTRSYRGAVPVASIMADLVADLNARLEEGDEPFRLGALGALGDEALTGWAYIGSTSQALDEVAEAFGWTWYEDDGVIRVNRAGLADSAAGEVALSPDTGLIGAPAVTDEGLRLTAFLDARYRLGAVVVLTSAGRERERWKIVTVSHHGNNETGPFRSELDLRAV